MIIFTKFHGDWVKIVDFSIKAYFWASNIFFESVSTILKVGFLKNVAAIIFELLCRRFSYLSAFEILNKGVGLSNFRREVAQQKS